MWRRRLRAGASGALCWARSKITRAPAGAHSLIAAISGENPDAIAFHAALGYREVAIVPEAGCEFDRWLDLHVLQKIL